MERGALQSWSKAEGDKLEEGDVLALVETDKSTMDMETPEEGYLAKILIKEGTSDINLGKVKTCVYVCVCTSSEQVISCIMFITAKIKVVI